MTFWSTEEAADAGIAGGRGFYAELEKLRDSLSRGAGT